MAGNEVTVTLAGDARSLQQAVGQAQAATTEMADSVAATGDQVNEANQQTSRYSDGLGKVGAAAAGFSAAIEDAGGTLTAFSDFMNRGQNRAREQARALLDVEQASADLEQAYGDLRQAQVDLNQSMIDAKQAGLDAQQAQIDAKQAVLDATEAQTAYNEAVKQHGAGSAEARQAAIDLQQAQTDLGQANLDAEQAANDLKQATEDSTQAQRDATQAGIDAKGAALDLAEAQSNANPGTLARWGKELEAVTPLIMGVIGATNLLILANELATASWIKNAAAQVGSRIATIASAAATGIATAAQWLWNAAFAASGIGLIIIGVVALVAAIVWLATQTQFFQKLWEVVWGAIVAYFKWVVGNYQAAVGLIVAGAKWIGDKIGAIPGLIKSAFAGLVNIISWPFRTAFNLVADAWNNTVGRLSWKVPGWVPIIGGNSISVPRLPKFHSGGVVPGAPGQEMLAILQAGETVTPAGGGRTVIELRSDGSRMGDALVEVLAEALRRGGGPDVAFGGSGG